MNILPILSILITLLGGWVKPCNYGIDIDSKGNIIDYESRITFYIPNFYESSDQFKIAIYTLLPIESVIVISDFCK